MPENESETGGIVEAADIAPVEIETPAPEETAPDAQAPEVQPEVEATDVAPAEMPRSDAMSSDGGSVQETAFRTQ